MSKIKILTNTTFTQTEGIAHVIFSFLNFVENNKKNNINIVAISITKQNKKPYKKSKGKKTGIISAGVKIPNIAKIIDKVKTLEQLEKKYESIIQIYQKAIQKEKPNIILINGTYYMPWCLLVASERENIPAVIHYHGILAKEIQNWKKSKRKIFLEMEKYFDKKNLFYIFPSKITKNTVEKEVFCHKIKKYSILPNPVPMHFFAKKNKVEKKNIGVVSRWAGIKNVQFCEKLAEYNQNQGGKFVLNIITNLNVKGKKYKKLSKLVKFHKPKTYKKLALFYRNMGVIISPSHFETYGNVAKEALASGTPALISPNMGVSETFKKLGLSDWIIEFDSVKSVYNKIENTMGKTVSEKTKNKMKKLYAPNKIFKELVSILTSAV